MKKVRFEFGDGNIYDGLTDGSTWNGFANIWVENDVYGKGIRQLQKIMLNRSAKFSTFMTLLFFFYLAQTLSRFPHPILQVFHEPALSLWLETLELMIPQ